MHGLLASVVQFCKMFGESSVPSYSPWPLSCREIWQSPQRLTQDLLSHTQYMEPRTNPYPTWFHIDPQRVVSSPPTRPHRLCEDPGYTGDRRAFVCAAKAFWIETYRKENGIEKHTGTWSRPRLAPPGVSIHTRGHGLCLCIQFFVFTKQKAQFAL